MAGEEAGLLEELSRGARLPICFRADVSLNANPGGLREREIGTMVAFLSSQDRSQLLVLKPPPAALTVQG